MITQKKADLTLAYHQDKLLENQNLAYLSVVARLDEKGHSTEDYYIEAGVLRVDVQNAAAADIAGAKKMSGDEEYVPTKLPVPSEGKPITLTDEFVEVDVVESREISALSHTDRRRPCEGGDSAGNPRFLGFSAHNPCSRAGSGKSLTDRVADSPTGSPFII